MFNAGILPTEVKSDINFKDLTAIKDRIRNS